MTGDVSAERDHLLRTLKEKGASDLHCKVGSPPAFRVGGILARGSGDRFTTDSIALLAQSILNDSQQAALLRDGSVVAAHSAPGIGRFRVAAFRQRGTIALVVHSIPHEIRRLEDLGLPDGALRLVGGRSGLVLVASPVGNGATTTLAALVDHVNRHRACHIVTVDEPIEILHRDDAAMVSQLEVGSDVDSLVDGVRSASRVDADVVVASDIVDRDVAMACLDAVARGRMVFAVLGGDTTLGVIKSFLELFTFEERPIVRQTFGRALAGILVQRLVRNQSGEAVLIGEALVKTPKIEQVIQADNRLDELNGLLVDGVFNGMQTIDQSLNQAVRAGRLEESLALAQAVDPEDLRIELLR